MPERETKPPTAEAEAPQPKPGQKPEAPRPVIDQQYARAAKEYVSDIGYDKDLDTAEYGNEIRRELTELSREDKLASLQPKEVSIALSELAGHMSVYNPNIESNLSSDPKSNANNEERYLKAKKLFMESCAKTFPDAKADFSNLTSVVGRLRTSQDTFASIADITNVQRLLREDPRKLAEQLDGLLHLAGSAMQERGFGAFRDALETGRPIDQAFLEKTQAGLAQATEAVYKLQLLRDQLQKEMYGRAEVTPREAREIDDISARVKGEQPREPSGAGAYSEPQLEQKRKESEELWRKSEEARRAKEAAAGKEQLPGKPKIEEDPNLEATALHEKRDDLGKDGPFKALYAEHKTPEEVKKDVTPEMKRLLLEKMLRDIDFGIKGAEDFVKKNPGMIVDRKGVAKFCGIGVTAAEAAVYQKITIAAEGRVIAPIEIARMPIADYLKRYLGYDLRADKKRADLLRKYTNALS